MNDKKKRSAFVQTRKSAQMNTMREWKAPTPKVQSESSCHVLECTRAKSTCQWSPYDCANCDCPWLSSDRQLTRSLSIGKWTGRAEPFAAASFHKNFACACLLFACLNSPQYKQTKKPKTIDSEATCLDAFSKWQLCAAVRNAGGQLHILNFKYIQRGREEDLSCFPAAEGRRHLKQVFYLFIFFIYFQALSQRHICADEPLFPRRTSGMLSATCDNSQLNVQRFVLFAIITDHFSTF